MIACAIGLRSLCFWLVCLGWGQRAPVPGSSIINNNKEHVLSIPQVRGPVLRASCASVHAVLIPAPQGGCCYPKAHAQRGGGVAPRSPLLFLPFFPERRCFLRAFPVEFGPQGPSGSAACPRYVGEPQECRPHSDTGPL